MCNLYLFCHQYMHKQFCLFNENLYRHCLHVESFVKLKKDDEVNSFPIFLFWT